MDQVKIQEFLKGRLYEIKPTDSKRLASRIFQRFDRDANKSISKRELRFVFREAYKGVNKKRKPKPAEIEGYFQMLNGGHKEKEITEEDLEKQVKYYFVKNQQRKTFTKIEIQDLTASDAQNDTKTKKEKLINIFKQRFGPKLLELCLDMCKKPFAEENIDLNKKFDYAEMFYFYKKINEKSMAMDKEEMHFEDYKGLMKRIANGEDKITYEQFEVLNQFFQNQFIIEDE